MDYNKIRIQLETKLGDELYDTMEGQILEDIIRNAKIEKYDNEWKYILEGHSFKVTREMAPKLHQIFEEVKANLKFQEAVEFFVSSSSQVNAYSIYRIEDEHPHIVNVNSGLIERLDDQELKFVLGHEIGHLITRNAHILGLIQFVFPDWERVPLILRNKINLWQKVSELTADRFGYLASPNLEKCVSGFFKLSSGLDTSRINFDFAAFLAENDKTLEYFRSENGINLMSHPINPIRIKAIQLFSESELFKTLVKGEALTDSIFEDKIAGLIQLLTVMSSSELDQARRLFIASAGLLMAGIDDKIDDEEIQHIVATLAQFTIFPKEFLTEIANSEKVTELFNQSAHHILNTNPAERYSMMEYCVNMILCDRNIDKEEIEVLFDIGKNFGFSDKEIAQIISTEIQKNFFPDLYSFN